MTLSAAWTGAANAAAAIQAAESQARIIMTSSLRFAGTPQEEKAAE
jgi:hypothetical protein